MEIKIGMSVTAYKSQCIGLIIDSSTFTGKIIKVNKKSIRVQLEHIVAKHGDKVIRDTEYPATVTYKFWKTAEDGRIIYKSDSKIYGIIEFEETTEEPETAEPKPEEQATETEIATEQAEETLVDNSRYKNKQYKGYYIDGVIFHNEKEIDDFRKEQAVKAYRIAVELFMIHKTVENSMYVDEKAENLVNNFGYTWEEVEELETEFYDNSYEKNYTPTVEEPKVEETTAAEETEEEPITEENTKVTEAEEKFSETYKKNAERMYALKTLMETARDRGDRELERKYRKEYTAIKSEIDMYALQIINQ